ncbi:endonuclease/Exonuclease/phosphatase family protein [Nocardia nova SH22a]|uniref:Endonuclease/Exonuclease/phosphatase family protein n=1 Tax=Nocardia nova SH22a TaxID=1415166 RepID=W5TH92_9NOCA|nr:endonuclease/exonuclease/phosphatase family protein [Nocardia nova]AHH18735.1 endonuclease/Exonuclease/phosphatase family protein [Nocardia nova SH22a]
MSKVVRNGLVVAAWPATLIGMVGVALHFSESGAWWLILAAAGAPYLMCGALLGAVVFLSYRRWIASAVALVVSAAAVWTQLPLYIGHGETGAGPEVRVMQANLLFDGANPQAVVDEVRTRHIEILTVEELTTGEIAGLERAGLDRLLPYRYLSPGRTATGTGIWSSYPLSDTTEYDGFVLNQLSATVTIPDAGPVTVYAFHPVPPVYGAHVWADELSRLRGILDRSPARPVIAGGDFNATQDHSQFRALASGRFADAALQAGAGHLVTYPTDKPWPPLIGVDHILVADGHASQVATVTLPGSDHRALVALVHVSR